jgi:GTP:adenosylcobinamide-phosphate guanylyltransferase
MSSSKSADYEIVDAVVLAGSRGSLEIKVGGRKLPKPYLELGGEPLVRRVVRATLGAKRVGRVFVVGREEMLEHALEPLLGEEPGRIHIVAEGESLVENGYRAFFLNLLPQRGLGAPDSLLLDASAVADYQQRVPESCSVPALVVTSDLPFLTSSDIDRFLDRDPGDAAIVIGLTDHREIEKMMSDIGEQSALDMWKLGAIHFRAFSVRLSNLFLFRPLMGNPEIYALAAGLYENRWLLKQDGSVNWRTWFRVARSILSYSIRVNGWLRFLRGLLNLLPSMAAASLARLTHGTGHWLSWPFRLFLGQKDVEFTGSTMVGARGVLAVGREVGPAIDIDVEESYYSLAADSEREYRRISNYLAQCKETEPDAGGQRECTQASGTTPDNQQQE